METYTFDGYKMTLEDTGRVDSMGKARVAYTFSKPDGTLLFEGNDLFASPLHDSDGIESARTLLSFLTLQPGDTDADYFDAYTPEQMEWAKSGECEQLSTFAYDEE